MDDLLLDEHTEGSGLPHPEPDDAPPFDDIALAQRALTNRRDAARLAAAILPQLAKNYRPEVYDTLRTETPSVAFYNLGFAALSAGCANDAAAFAAVARIFGHHRLTWAEIDAVHDA